MNTNNNFKQGDLVIRKGDTKVQYVTFSSGRKIHLLSEQGSVSKKIYTDYELAPEGSKFEFAKIKATQNRKFKREDLVYCPTLNRSGVVIECTSEGLVKWAYPQTQVMPEEALNLRVKGSTHQFGPYLLTQE